MSLRIEKHLGSGSATARGASVGPLASGDQLGIEIVTDGQGGLWRRGELGVEVCGDIAWLDVSGVGVV